MVQFVPLKVDTDGGESWQKWASKYKHEGNGIPIIFIIRADGQMMYGKSGGMGADALRTFMAQQLAQAGRVLTDVEARLLDDAVQTAQKALDEDDTGAAVKALASLRKVGPPGQLGSYAKAALEADKLVEKVLEDARQSIAKAREAIEGGNGSFEAVRTLVEARRVYSAFPELKREVIAATRDLNREDSLREMVQQAEALDRALALGDLAGGESKAAAALERLLEQYPDGPAAEAARQALARLPADAGTSSVASRPDRPSTGPAATPARPSRPSPASTMSAADARKKASSSLRMAKVFADKRPEKARKYAEEVLELAPGSADAREAEALLERLK